MLDKTLERGGSAGLSEANEMRSWRWSCAGPPAFAWFRLCQCTLQIARQSRDLDHGGGPSCFPKEERHELIVLEQPLLRESILGALHRASHSRGDHEINRACRWHSEVTRPRRSRTSRLIEKLGRIPTQDFGVHGLKKRTYVPQSFHDCRLWPAMQEIQTNPQGKCFVRREKDFNAAARSFSTEEGIVRTLGIP